MAQFINYNIIMAENYELPNNQASILERPSQSHEPPIITDKLTEMPAQTSKDARQNQTHINFIKTPIEQLSIEIDCDGHKKFVDLNGHQQKIYPYPHKFFDQSPGSRKDANEVENFEKQMQQARERLKMNYTINETSPIFNYTVREVTLLGQRYDNMLKARTKEAIMHDYRMKRIDLVCAGVAQIPVVAFIGLSLRTTWSKLTTNLPVRLFLFANMTLASIDAVQKYKYMHRTAILQHHQEYEKIIRQYESEENLATN